MRKRSTHRPLIIFLAGVVCAALFTAPAFAQDPEDFTYVSLNRVGRIAVLHNNAVLTTINIGGRPTGVAVSANGERVYAARGDNATVTIIDATRIVASLTDPAVNPVLGTVNVGSTPEDLAITPDGSQVFVVNVFDSARFSVIDTALAESSPGTAVTPINNNTVGGSPFGIASADVPGASAGDPSRALVFAAFNVSAGARIAVIDPTNLSYVTNFPTGGVFPQDVAASLDGRRVYVAHGTSNTVSVIDTALVLARIADGTTDPVIAQIPVPDGPWGLAVSSDGETVYVTRNSAAKVTVLDATRIGGPDDPFVTEIDVGVRPQGVAFAPDDTQALIANRDGNSVSVILGGGSVAIPFNTLGLGQTQPRWVAALPGQPPPDTSPSFSLSTATGALACGGNIAAILGQELVVNVSATDDNGAVVTMTEAPAGGALDAPFPTTAGSPVVNAFRWTPTAADPAGDYDLSFEADDGVNQVVSCTVTIVVPSPPVNTPAGSNVNVAPIDPNTSTAPASLTFDEVTVGGDTTLVTSSTGPALPQGFAIGNPPVFFDIATTATFSGNVSVCIDYGNLTFADESAVTLQHFSGGAWQDVTGSLDTANNVVCGNVTSFSFFAVAEAVPEPEPDEIEFAAFHLGLAKVSTRGHFADSFWFNGNFRLDVDTGDGIDPAAEQVEITIEGATWVIPAGSFDNRGNGRLFRFRGEVDGTYLLVHIVQRGRRGRPDYNINVTGWRGNLNADNPLEMCVTIGDDFGCASRRGWIR